MKKHRGFMLPHGNYRELLSYKKSKVVYDVTFTFCRRFLTRGDRTIDQVIQAARSGKQNILEGSKEQSIGYVEGDGNQTHEHREGQPGRTAGRLPRFSSIKRVSTLGQRQPGIVVCSAARDEAELQRFPRVLRHSFWRGRRQHCRLSHPPCELSPRPTNPASRAGFHQRRWYPGTDGAYQAPASASCEAEKPSETSSGPQRLRPISPMCPIGPIHARLRRVSRESCPPPHLNALDLDGEDDCGPAATAPSWLLDSSS
jgi:hypothetical protein